MLLEDADDPPGGVVVPHRAGPTLIDCRGVAPGLRPGLPPGQQPRCQSQVRGNRAGALQPQHLGRVVLRQCDAAHHHGGRDLHGIRIGVDGQHRGQPTSVLAELGAEGLDGGVVPTGQEGDLGSVMELDPELGGIIANWLNQNGVAASAYYGDVKADGFETSDAYRQHLEQQLLTNRIKALVATTALGMGHDKPDLGFVAHYQAPGSIVADDKHSGRFRDELVTAVVEMLQDR